MDEKADGKLLDDVDKNTIVFASILAVIVAFGVGIALGSTADLSLTQGDDSPEFSDEISNFNYPSGIEPTGLNNSTSDLLQSHSETLRSQSYSVFINSTQTGQRTTTQSLQYRYDDEDRIALSTQSVNGQSLGTEVFENYSNGQTLVAENLTTDNVTYTSQNLSQNPYTGDVDIAQFLSASNLSASEVVETGNGDELVYNITGTADDLTQQQRDALGNLTGQVTINENGYVGSLSVSFDQLRRGGFRTGVTQSVDVANVASTEVVEPDWLPEAREQTNSTEGN